MRMKTNIESWKPKLPPQCELSVAEVEKVGRNSANYRFVPRRLWADRTDAVVFELHLQGLLSDAERKNLEAIALKWTARIGSATSNGS